MYSAEGLTQGKFLPDKILICQSSKFTHFTAACLELWQYSAYCLLGFVPLNIQHKEQEFVTCTNVSSSSLVPSSQLYSRQQLVWKSFKENPKSIFPIAVIKIHDNDPTSMTFRTKIQLQPSFNVCIWSKTTARRGIALTILPFLFEV